MRWNFDLVSILLIVFICLFVIFCVINIIRFKKFIMQNSERERLFTDAQFEKYIAKFKEMNQKKVDRDSKDDDNMNNVDFKF